MTYAIETSGNNYQQRTSLSLLRTTEITREITEIRTLRRITSPETNACDSRKEANIQSLICCIFS